MNIKREIHLGINFSRSPDTLQNSKQSPNSVFLIICAKFSPDFLQNILE